MKLHEVTIPPHYYTSNNKKRQARLKVMVDSGMIPDVYDAGFVEGMFTFGDLEAVGYAEREYYDRDDSDFYWRYTGPKPIDLYMKFVKAVHGKFMTAWKRHRLQPGEDTEHIKFAVPSDGEYK